MLIAVDFDGTIVEHEYPRIGKERPFATQTLKMLLQDGHRLVLWTNRQGKTLEEALPWCRERGVEFYAVNKCFPEETFEHNEPRKLKVDLFIDDRNVGGLPEWGVIYELVTKHMSYQDYLVRELTGETPKTKKKKKHWWF